MNYTKDELEEAHRQIISTLNKLRRVVETLENKESASRFKSQITLAKRRINAFEIADQLIKKELLSKFQE